MSTPESLLDYDEQDTRPRFAYARHEDPRIHPQAPRIAALKACLEAAGDETDLALQRIAEAECLRSHAGVGGWGIDPQAFSLTFRDARVGGGNEHDVFFDPDSQRVIKLTTNLAGYGTRGTALEYLTNLENSNLLFGDSLPFEGILETSRGFLIVTSQPFVHGAPATEKEIAEFFEALGFADKGRHSFHRQGDDNGNILVCDARPDNVFKERKTSLVVPIDVQILVR